MTTSLQLGEIEQLVWGTVFAMRVASGEPESAKLQADDAIAFLRERAGDNPAPPTAETGEAIARWESVVLPIVEKQFGMEWRKGVPSFDQVAALTLLYPYRGMSRPCSRWRIRDGLQDEIDPTMFLAAHVGFPGESSAQVLVRGSSGWIAAKAWRFDLEEVMFAPCDHAGRRVPWADAGAPSPLQANYVCRALLRDEDEYFTARMLPHMVKAFGMGAAAGSDAKRLEVQHVWAPIDKAEDRQWFCTICGKTAMGSKPEPTLCRSIKRLELAGEWAAAERNLRILEDARRVIQDVVKDSKPIDGEQQARIDAVMRKENEDP